MQPANKRIFTEEEIQYLKEHYATTKNRILQERLGISRTLLQMTARKLGLRKIPTFQSDFVKAAKKHNDGRAKNRPSQKAIDNSRAALKRLRQDSEYHTYTKIRCTIQEDIFTQYLGKGNDAIRQKSYDATRHNDCPYIVPLGTPRPKRYKVTLEQQTLFEK